MSFAACHLPHLILTPVACRGVVFGGGISPDLTAPPYHYILIYMYIYHTLSIIAQVNSLPPLLKCENRWSGKEFTWCGGKKRKKETAPGKRKPSERPWLTLWKYIISTNNLNHATFRLLYIWKLWPHKENFCSSLPHWPHAAWNKYICIINNVFFSIHLKPSVEIYLK